MTLTDSLRDALEALGVKYTCGYTMKGGKAVNEDNVTCVWPDNDPRHTVTFEEEDGYGCEPCLHVEDGITVTQAIAIALAG